MIRLSQLKGQRVLAQDNAQMVGSIRRLLLDAESARIVAIELEGVPDAHTIVEWPAVTAIGRDSVTIETTIDRRGPLDETEQAFIGGQLDLEGKLVLDDGGDGLGRLADVVFDERSGRVVELEVSGNTIPVERIVAFGAYALIVPAAA